MDRLVREHHENAGNNKSFHYKIQKDESPENLKQTNFAKDTLHKYEHLDKPNTPHYESKKIQPLEYILKNKLNFCEGNIVKYITRYKEKNGLEDLLKAKDYLETLIKNYK